MQFWWAAIVCGCIAAPLSASEVQIHSSIEDPVSSRRSEVARRSRQLKVIKIIKTTTTTTTVSTSTICAKLVNVTGACFRVRNKWVNEPIVLSFDEDMDEIDKFFSPLRRIEVTTQPVDIVEKTVAIEYENDDKQANSEEYDIENEYEEDDHSVSLTDTEQHNLVKEIIENLSQTEFSTGEWLSVFDDVFDSQSVIESSFGYDHRLPKTQPEIVELVSQVVTFMDHKSPKKHCQKRQDPAGLFLLVLQLLLYVVASSGFNGNLQNFLRPNDQNQEAEQQTPSLNIPVPRTQYYTSTSTETVTVYSTTATLTVFIEGCTPNPFQYGQCA